MVVRPLIEQWRGVERPVVGVVHLAALPGAAGYESDFEAVVKRAVADAGMLEEAGVDGVMVENYGDSPFYPGRVPVETVAAMTVAVAAVCGRVSVPVGVNVLRNDGCAAMAIAAATGARFVRVNVLCGARVTDQGIVEGIAHELMRMRKRLGAEGVAVLADVNVKHSAALGAVDVARETADAIERGMADGVIVTGSGTGVEADLGELRAVRQVAAKRGAEVFVGSGVTQENAGMYAGEVDGFIVGSSLKREGSAGNEVDGERARRVVAALKRERAR